MADCHHGPSTAVNNHGVLLCRLVYLQATFEGFIEGGGFVYVDAENQVRPEWAIVRPSCRPLHECLMARCLGHVLAGAQISGARTITI